MTEFDNLLKDLQTIIRDSTYCEDNEIHIRNKLKYDLFNLVEAYDYRFIEKLKKELEYERME